MKMKKVLVLVVALLLAVSLCACANQESAQEPAQNSQSAETSQGGESTSDEKFTVGVTFQDLSNEWIAMMKDAMEYRVKNYPQLELIINDGEGSPETQTSQVETFIAQGVDAMIINPTDANMMIPAVENAVNSGVPVVTLSSDVVEDVGQVWVGAENSAGGALVAQWVVDQLGEKGNVAIMRGPIGAIAEIQRFEGYDEVFSQYDGIEIVFDQTANWSREESMSLMENWLQTGTQIDAVVCQNDEMALGALSAIEAAGKLDEIIVVGMDGIPDALASIKDGKLKATGFQGAIDQAFGAVDMIAQALDGEEIAYTDIPFELITAENVDSYYERIELPEE